MRRSPAGAFRSAARAGISMAAMLAAKLAVWREVPDDPTKVPGTVIAEDGGYGSRSQFEAETRWLDDDAA